MVVWLIRVEVLRYQMVEVVVLPLMMTLSKPIKGHVPMREQYLSSNYSSSPISVL